jgi:hypothetical protein
MSPSTAWYSLRWFVRVFRSVVQPEPGRPRTTVEECELFSELAGNGKLTEHLARANNTFEATQDIAERGMTDILNRFEDIQRV